MGYTLRPGERVVFRWDNIGKYACHSEKWDQQPPVFGNSKFIYAPPRDSTGRRGESGARSGLRRWTARPWAICGGTLRAEFIGGGSEDKFALDVSLDGKEVHARLGGRRAAGR